MIMTAAIGFLMIIAIVALLLKGKMSPIVVLAVIPVIAALILGFSPVEVMDFIADGIKTTTSNGILFIFSVIYFGVLADTGLFDVIVGWLVKKAGNNVIAVTVVTALIATIAHLDGTTAVTVLITIPAMYPVYKKMNIDSRILLCLTGACMGVMNLLPWGGPTARAATVLAMDATELWHMLIPLQVVGLMMNIILAVLLGMLAIKHGAGAGKGVEVESDEKEKKEAADLRKSNAYLIFNFLLTVMERGTEYALEQIYNIVDSRYRSRKPLIVTTNLTLDEIRHPQDTVHARIYDRLLEMCVPVSCIGASFRKESAQEKLEQLKLLIG